MSEHDHLAPALVERASKVVKVVHRQAPGIDPGSALARVLDGTLQAMGNHRLAPTSADLVTDYRPELLNTDLDLAALCEGLRKDPRGRLCFYGAPGTGKTAFGRHLAEVLDRPLLVKRGSDLLSPYVGVTEKLIARMYEEASTEDAVLLLDEADSFLQDRKGAERSWEVTQVNEMLTQMEAHQGVFIASTNLMDRLDPAALRRFDLKILFNPLKPEQAWAMFQDAAKRLGIGLDEAMRPALEKLRLLTPGDFAAVLRQSRLRKVSAAADLVERLAEECALKPGGRRGAIGF